jgi:hypothetical protein
MARYGAEQRGLALGNKDWQQNDWQRRLAAMIRIGSSAP